MKSLSRFILTVSTFVLAAAMLCSAVPSNSPSAEPSNSTSAVPTSSTFEQKKPPRIASVNFKTCVEKSKLGQKEQSSFEAMKKQMETILEEKEKALTDVASKFNDIDYLDSLSPEAEAELKRQFRTLNQEFNQQQNQFYQQLSQTNMQVIQKLNDAVTKAAEEVAKKNQIDIVLNQDGCFFCVAGIDISNLVVRVMDETYEKESKDAKPSASLPAQ
jgi:outer membrane protein